MGIPVVIAENGKGVPVRPVEGNAPVMTVAENGLGAPIVISDNGAPFVIEGYEPEDFWNWQEFDLTAGDGGQWVGYSDGGDTRPQPAFGSISGQPTSRTTLLALYDDTASGIVLAVFAGNYVSQLEGLQVSLGGFVLNSFESELISGNTWVRFDNMPGVWSPGDVYQVTFITGGVPWTPMMLPGLEAWLDPRDESTITYRDGTFIAQVADKSGNGNHDTQPTAAQQPATRDSAGFIITSGSRRMLNPLSAAASDRWMFGVVKTPISGNRTMSGASAQGGIQYRLNGTGKPETNRQGQAFRSTPNMDMLVAANTPTFVGVRYGVGATDVYYVSGLSAPGTFVAGALASTTTVSYSNDIGQENLNGGRGGWLIGRGALTADDIANIRVYFSSRYGAV